MLLDATTKKIQVKLGEAHTTTALDVVTSWFDSGATPSGGEADTVTNGTTSVDIVAAPASNYIRQVKYISIFNADTVSHVVKILYNNNATVRQISPSITVAVGQCLQWTPKDGWQLLTGTGLAVTLPSFPSSLVLGTTTNDAAAAGGIGEFQSATKARASAVSITSNSAIDIISVSLTAGDWDVEGHLAVEQNTTTVLTTVDAWLSSSSATIPTFPNSGGIMSVNVSFTVGTGITQLFPTGTKRFSLSTTTTIYLTGYALFTVSTLTGYGFIQARRVR